MLLIKNIRLIDPKSKTDSIKDILIEDDKIAEIAEEIELQGLDEDTLLIDGSELCAAPGLVDVHVHFRDPGFEYKEDVLTGANAAKAGGYTSVVCMANTKPAADNMETIRYVEEKGKLTGIHVYQAGAITKGLKGQELTDIEGMNREGVAGFTDDGIPIMDEKLVETAMELSARLNVPLSFHEEDPAYITNNGVNAGEASVHYGIGGSDRKAEISLIERDLKLALKTNAIINVQHISSMEGVKLVREAVKAQKEEQTKNQAGEVKRRIHAEACPHHFTLTEQACIEKGTLAKMNPPLRTEADRKAILEGLKDGTIDIIATDHAPHSVEEKSKPITEAPSGIIGLETALGLGITQLVKTGVLSLSELLEKMTINPASLYGLDAGYVAEGSAADLVIFDPNQEWTVPESFSSKAVNTPFVGEKLYGRVIATICSGSIVYHSHG